MLKKLICLTSILMIFSSASIADEMGGAKDWATLSEVENAWDGQKMIKNEDYDKVVDELEKRKNAKKIRANKRAGQALMKESTGTEMDFLSKFEEQYPLLNLTVPMKVGNKEIPVGHYKVIGVNDNGRVFLNLCQSYDVVARIPANLTEDDFNENEINFVKIEDVGNNVLILKYGSMKFNAYAYTNY